jgi:hypothetical protein
MCSGVEYQGEMHLWSDLAVHLPVRLKGGDLAWVRRGARHGVESPFFQGPCARLDSIKMGKWARFSPIPVRIPIERYMERDSRNKPYWVKAKPGGTLQGLVATWQGQHRVYVVTVDTPPEFQHVQPRWPRVLA